MRSATLELNQADRFASPKPANFDRLARVYRWLEWFTFGPILWQCRCVYLDEMKSRKAALVIGDGDGRFTAELLKRNQRIAVDAVDASNAMLRQLKQQAGHNASRVHVHLADVRQVNLAPCKFDLIATHFLLDCLTTVEVESLARRLKDAMTFDAIWIVSEFAIPDNWYGHLIARPLVTGLYIAFGFLTGLSIRELPRHREALQTAGFVLTKQQKRMWGLLVSELWESSPIANSRSIPKVFKD
ncbi:MAG: class I SAM-dependent methyltransferase [Terracidiphilus sp.]